MPGVTSILLYKSMVFRLTALCLALSAVLAAASPEFEVATVKQSAPSDGGPVRMNLGRLENGKLTFDNASLGDCLKFAYGIISDAQLIGPDWIKSKDVRFDIVAEAPLRTTLDQIDLMLQNLLADRLKVTVHHEQKKLPYLVLVVGKNGPKLQEAKHSTGDNAATRGRILANSMPMKSLALLLSRYQRQTVLDMTGLKGDFAFNLEWTMDDGVKSDDSGPSIFAAVQEQLGLKLESRKGPLDVLVVDHAEKIPTDN